MAYDYKQGNRTKYLENCQKGRMVKLVLRVNKFVLLQILGQSFLFYFGQMRLSIPKQKKSLSRYNLGLITTQESSFKLKPCLRKKMKTFFCAMDSFTLFSDPRMVKAADLKTLITRAVRLTVLQCSIFICFCFLFEGDGTNRVHIERQPSSRLGSRISSLGRVPARRSEVPTRSGSVPVPGMLASKYNRQEAETDSTNYIVTNTLDK